MTIDLPATELANFFYNQMFKGCTNLTVAPELPTGEDDNGDLKEGCYQGMFQNCTSLEYSPVLPAKKLFDDCYNSMFSGCTSLSYVTCFANDGIGANTSGWMSNVAEEGTFFKAAGVSWPRGENGIPTRWTIEP